MDLPIVDKIFTSIMDLTTNKSSTQLKKWPKFFSGLINAKIKHIHFGAKSKVLTPKNSQTLARNKNEIDSSGQNEGF